MWPAAPDAMVPRRGGRLGARAGGRRNLPADPGTARGRPAALDLCPDLSETEVAERSIGGGRARACPTTCARRCASTPARRRCCRNARGPCPGRCRPGARQGAAGAAMPGCARWTRRSRPPEACVCEALDDGLMLKRPSRRVLCGRDVGLGGADRGLPAHRLFRHRALGRATCGALPIDRGDPPDVPTRHCASRS